MKFIKVVLWSVLAVSVVQVQAPNKWKLWQKTSTTKPSLDEGDSSESLDRKPARHFEDGGLPPRAHRSGHASSVSNPYDYYRPLAAPRNRTAPASLVVHPVDRGVTYEFPGSAQAIKDSRETWEMERARRPIALAGNFDLRKARQEELALELQRIDRLDGAGKIGEANIAYEKYIKKVAEHRLQGYTPEETKALMEQHRQRLSNASRAEVRSMANDLNGLKVMNAVVDRRLRSGAFDGVTSVKDYKVVLEGLVNEEYEKRIKREMAAGDAARKQAARAPMDASAAKIRAGLRQSNSAFKKSGDPAEGVKIPEPRTLFHQSKMDFRKSDKRR